MPKSDFVFHLPLMNAAGMLGLAPDPHDPVELARLGAFITHPISRVPRTPANGTRLLRYPGGFLLHTGLPNPGLSKVLRRYARYWAAAPLPVIVHLLAENPDELAWMVERVEGVAGVAGVEVGLPPGADASLAAQFAQAALGELPLMVRVPVDGGVALARAAWEAGASLISLGAPRGQVGELTGRLYGPAIFPLALRAVQTLAEAGMPVVGAGGVRTTTEIESMLTAGAHAVQVGPALWRVGRAAQGLSIPQRRD